MKIQNPSKWVGKYVRHMKNWRDFQFTCKYTNPLYFVCEYTGKLTLATDSAYYGDVFASFEDAQAAGFDECYDYSEEGLYQMWAKAHKNGKAA